MKKASYRKGNTAKPGQKYQNKTAYKPHRDQPTHVVAEHVIQRQEQGLCVRCIEILQWRRQFNKYKPLTLPRRCLHCQQKTVKCAYHVLCQVCAGEQHVCAKCRCALDESGKEGDEGEDPLMGVDLSGLPERVRRTVVRKGGHEGLAVMQRYLEKQAAALDGDYDFISEDDEADSDEEGPGEESEAQEE